MKESAKLVWLAVLISAAIGCGGEERLDPELERLGRAQAPAATGAQMPPGMPPAGMGKRMVAGDGPLHEGEVVETIQVPRYTYLKLKDAAGNLEWTAIPSDKVAVGARVAVRESIQMSDFHSRTLNRTFATIIFGTLVDGKQGSPAKADAGAAGQLPPGHPPIGAAAAGDSAPSEPSAD